MEDQYAPVLYSEPGGELDLRHHVGILRGRLWTILACLVAVFSLVAVTTFRSDPVYESSARLLIERRLPRATPFGDAPERRDKEYFQTQVQLIKSKAVLEQALEHDGVAEVFTRDDGPVPVGLLGSVRRELRHAVGNVPARPPEPWERLREVLSVHPIPDTDLVEVRVKARDPEASSRVANAVARAYVDHSVATQRESAVEAFAMLERQRLDQEGALNEAEDRLSEYRESSTVPELGSPGQPSPAVDRWRVLSNEHTNVQLRRIELSVAADTIRERQAGDDDSALPLLSVKVIREDPTVRELIEAQWDLEIRRQLALKSYGEKHPDVVALDERLAHVRTRMGEALAEVAESIQGEHAMLVARERELQLALQDESERALERARIASEYERFKRDVERQKRVFEVIVDRMREVDLVKDETVTNVSLAEAAVAPQRPVSPNTSRNLVLGVFLGMFLGLGTAYGLEFLDDTVKSPEDVEERLGLPWLGYVPRMKKMVADSQNGLIGTARQALLEPGGTYAESFRSIRTNIYFSGERGQIKSVMTTSATPGEGKTVFASNIAAAIAHEGRKVLLVDADLRRPMIHKALGVERSPGLTNMLVEGLPFEDLVQTAAAGEAELSNFHVMPAGSKAPNPAELLGSSAMAQFMEKAREEYDMVVYDSCPAMFVADNAALASGCDGVVVILEAAQTRRATAQRAVKQIENIDGNIIGVVLNKVQPRTMSYYGAYSGYYYGYEYAYGDYVDEEETEVGDLLTEEQSLQPALPHGATGGAQRDSGPGDEAAPQSLHFVIRARNGRDIPWTLGPEAELVFGRSSTECNIKIALGKVSRRHCRLLNAAGRLMVEDLGSGNGTFLNGESVERAPVKDGDVIDIGGYELRIMEITVAEAAE